jgi:hypothetical protein
MHLVNQSHVTEEGDFSFEMQSLVNEARTVKYSLSKKDAEQLHGFLAAYIASLATKKKG